MKRWFWILDAVAVLSFAYIGSDFHGFGRTIVGVLVVALPFLIALGGGIGGLKAWRDPLAGHVALLLPLITTAAGMALRYFVWGRNVPSTFILVTAAYLLGCMVGWRLIAIGVERFSSGSSGRKAAA